VGNNFRNPKLDLGLCHLDQINRVSITFYETPRNNVRSRKAGARNGAPLKQSLTSGGLKTEVEPPDIPSF
jgi:hypothetical protein